MYRIVVYLGLQQCCVHRSVTVCCPLIMSRLKSRLLYTNSCRHTTLKFQPNHWIVVRKHFRTLMSGFTEIHKLWKYQFAKEKFPHSFSLLFPLSFLSTTQGGGGGMCAVRARYQAPWCPFALPTARPLNGLQYFCFCAVPLRRATDAVTWLVCALVNSYVRDREVRC